MVSTYTPNKNYELQGTGDNVNTWGPPLNANFSILDSNLAGRLSVALSSSDVTLNATQAQNAIYLLTGTLSANVSLLFPAVGGIWTVVNGTSGNFSVTVKTVAVGSVGTIVPQGSSAGLYSDATNVRQVQTVTETPAGSIIDFGGSSVPSGWLLCDGSAISRTTYAVLFAAISTTWGAGNGTTTFNLPDLRGRSRAGRDNMGGSAAGRITTAASGIDGLTIGAAGGAQGVILTMTEIPIFTPSGAVSVAYPSQAYLLATGGTSYQAGSSASAFNNYTTAATTPPDSRVFNLVMSQLGGGQGHQNMQPTAIVNSIIKY